MQTVYQIAEKKDRKALTEFLTKNGQVLLPMVELIEQTQLALDEFIDLTGRACIEAVLEISAEGVAGARHQGKQGGEIRRHGKQQGSVCLSTQKVHIDKPRLRRRGAGRNAEVPVPAYEAMQSDRSFTDKLHAIVMRGVSTRNYEAVVPEVAESCGISKSAVSRRFVESSTRALEQLCARRFDDKDLLVIYLDGVRFQEHHVVAAIGVDAQGEKHVLGLAEGATENATVVKGLLEDLVARGVRPDRRRLFVIDGSKALRAAIDAVFGGRDFVQRCRKHKVSNVVDYLPKELGAQVASVMRAAYRLEAEEGLSKLRKQAEWLDREYPSAAASLREGLEETFTINRLDLPPDLRRCLATTNIIESPISGVRARTDRVTNWQDGKMVLRWAAATYTVTEENFRKILGYRSLWTLKARLDEDKEPDRREAIAA